MKIFYAVQATGNGHISRAMELLPHLERHGKVDIFLSGANSSLPLDAPVKFRSRGLSLFYKCDGGLDYWKMLTSYAPVRLRKEINELPVEDYDLVINDFDYITAAACAKKNIRSVNMGHQASFMSDKTPRPEKDNRIGEWVLKNYARADEYIGLHFEEYDDFILTPVIKQDILEAQPRDKGYITVYLPAYCEPQLKTIFSVLKEFRFEIFSRESRQIRTEENITFKPVSRDAFTQSLIKCTALITGGGFETPAEAIHLGKKIMSIPIRGQYEQLCNGAALAKEGITCLPGIDEMFMVEFYNWLLCKEPVQKDYSQSIPRLIDRLMTLAGTAPARPFLSV